MCVCGLRCTWLRKSKKLGKREACKKEKLVKGVKSVEDETLKNINETEKGKNMIYGIMKDPRNQSDFLLFQS